MRRGVILFWLLTVGCAAWAQAETLRIGFGTDKPPYVFEAKQRGLEVDIVTEAAKRSGFTVRPFFAPMERLHYMQETGQLDAIATSNPSSGLHAYFSKPYIAYHNYAVALARRNLQINAISDLQPLSVSAFQRARKLLGPEFEAMAERNPNYREEALQITRNRLLYSGRVDVVIGDRSIIEYFNQQISGRFDVTQPVVWYDIFPPTDYEVAFRKQDIRDRFDQGLDQLRNSGRYHAIERRYQARKG